MPLLEALYYIYKGLIVFLRCTTSTYVCKNCISFIKSNLFLFYSTHLFQFNLLW